MIYCSKCGAQNEDSSNNCTECGQALMKPAAGSDVVSSVIPYKNVYALIAYYMAVFSLIPCLGLFLGIGAFILGLQGLKLAKEHPEAKGRAHAWIGIIVGGICGLINLAVVILSAIPFILHR